MIPWQTLPKRRLLIDTDAKCEADDQFAIVHALLTPTFDVRGIVPTHFGDDPAGDSMARSRAEVDLLLDLLDMTDRVAVADGAPVRIDDPGGCVDSPGARLIVEESRRGPLTIAALGSLTDVASAVRLDPELAGRDVEVVWIGGGPYDDIEPSCWPCYNLAGDRHAANAVFASGLRIRQIPISVYGLVWVGYAELAARVAPHGRIGRYLVEQLIEFNRDCDGRPLEGRCLGDSPAIGVAMNPDIATWRRRGPVQFDEQFRPVPGREGADILVSDRIDVRYVLEDFFAKLKAAAQGPARP